MLQQTKVMGTFVVGKFEGIVEDHYSTFLVRVDPYTIERITLYESGRSGLPAELSEGQMVSVRVKQKAQCYSKRGQPSAFVASQVLDVEILRQP